MKKLFLSIIYFIIWIESCLAGSLQSKMLPSEAWYNWASWEWTAPLSNLVVYAKNFIFSILWLIVVWVFLYHWYNLVTSKWKPDEFKKAIMWLIYTIVWLSIIPLAWTAVKIISWITL